MLFAVETPAGLDLYLTASGPSDALNKARMLTGNGFQEEMGLPNLSPGDVQPCHVRAVEDEEIEAL